MGENRITDRFHDRQFRFPIFPCSPSVRKLQKQLPRDELNHVEELSQYLKARYVFLRHVSGNNGIREAWFYVFVDPGKLEALEAIRNDQLILHNVSDYGKVVRLGWDETPSDVEDDVNTYYKIIPNNLFVEKRDFGGKFHYYYFAVEDLDKKDSFLNLCEKSTVSRAELEETGSHYRLYGGWGFDPPECMSRAIESGYFDRNRNLSFDNFSKTEEAMFSAIANGNLQGVKEMLLKGVDVNRKWDFTKDWTWLHFAAFFGHLEILKCLLERGADPDAQDSLCGRKPVHIAAREGNVPVVKHLLKQADDTDHNGWTPLHYAARMGHVDTVRILVNNGANVHAIEFQKGFQPLHSAARGGHVDVIRFLLIKGVAVDIVDKDGRTSLYMAVFNGSLETVKFLRNNGASINGAEMSKSGTNPLHVAAIFYPQMVKYLVSEGASVHDRDKRGWTPLHCAAAYGEMDVAQFFLSVSADLHAKTEDGQTALDLAETNEHKEMVAYLLEKSSYEMTLKADMQTKPTNLKDYSRLQ